MQIRGSEAEVSTVPGGEGFGMAGLGKLRGRRTGYATGTKMTSEGKSLVGYNVTGSNGT